MSGRRSGLGDKQFTDFRQSIVREDVAEAFERFEVSARLQERERIVAWLEKWQDWVDSERPDASHIVSTMIRKLRAGVHENG